MQTKTCASETWQFSSLCWKSTLAIQYTFVVVKSCLLLLQGLYIIFWLVKTLSHQSNPWSIKMWLQYLQFWTTSVKSLCAIFILSSVPKARLFSFFESGTPKLVLSSMWGVFSAFSGGAVLVCNAAANGLKDMSFLGSDESKGCGACRSLGKNGLPSGKETQRFKLR